MFTISSSLPIGNTDAAIATRTPTITVMRTGVPCGPVLANCRGISPSRDIANSTRVCPSTSTITTVVRRQLGAHGQQDGDEPDDQQCT
jgi:hypothetical protein